MCMHKRKPQAYCACATHTHTHTHTYTHTHTHTRTQSTCVLILTLQLTTTTGQHYYMKFHINTAMVNYPSLVAIGIYSYCRTRGQCSYVCKLKRCVPMQITCAVAPYSSLKMQYASAVICVMYDIHKYGWNHIMGRIIIW